MRWWLLITYDNAGNVKTIIDTANGQTQNFDYDHRDRLTRAWTANSPAWLAAYDESYEYTVIGNIDKKGPTGSPVAYGYNPSGAGSVRPHAATSVGGAAYAYDANGNLTSRTGKTIAWNADNTVASVVGPDNVPEGYTYDAGGGRVTRSRNLGQVGGFTTAYLGGLYEEDTPSGEKRLAYSFAGRVVAQRAIPAGGGNGTVTYLHGDHLGSVSATSSAGGALNAQQMYTPWGAIRTTNGLATTRAFTGQRQDGTGLLFYNARYYDPAIGRFASADSLVPGAARGPVATAAALHFAASTPNFKVQEHFNDFAEEWVKALAPGNPEVADGHFALPRGPGLGVALDLDAVAAHPRRHVFFNLYDEDWHRRLGSRAGGATDGE